MRYDRDLAIEVGTVFQQRYQVLEKLSEGGFGVIYRAEQLATGQSVALKCLWRRGRTREEDLEQLNRFRREASLCARLHHPNIVRLIDSGTSEDDITYTVFEFVPGANLRSVLRDEGALAPVETKYLMMQVLDALACAHAEGIVHRDLKPENVMIVPTGARRNATVLDFGISALLLEDGESPDTTYLRRTGTPAYASPEQLRGVELDERSDIYSFGLVFLECLTGHRAVAGGSIAAVIHAQLDPTPVPIPHALAEHPLGDLLRATLAKNPEKRSNSAARVLAALESCEVGDLEMGDEALSPRSAERRPERRRRSRRPSSLSVTLTDDSIPTPLARVSPGPATRGSARDPAMRPASVPAQASADALADTQGMVDASALTAAATSMGNQATLTGLRPAPEESERRQLTVVSCGIDIAEPDPESLDLEEYEELLRAHTDRCAAFARESGAYIAQATEGRVVLYHGYPRASDDDARRAVHNALALVAEFQQDAARPAVRGRAEVRIGVHTGMVLVHSAVERSPPRVSVATPRLANLLDTIADPNTVVVSEATRRLLGESLPVTSLGRRRLHGYHRPVHLYRISAVIDPLESYSSASSTGRDRSPFIGREAELSFLRRHWESARDGRGQAVLLSGDAGLGKSRLVHELSLRLLGESLTWLETHCIPDHVHSALRPMRDVLERALGIHRDTGLEGKLARLEQMTRTYGLDPERAVPPLARFLDIPPDENDALARLAPRRIRELTLSAISSLLLEMAASKPLVLVVENLQWADASTLELLGSLLEEASMAPIYLLFTARVEFSSPWQNRRVNAYQLDRLSAADSATLVQESSGLPLPDSIVAEILARADGVPLFIAETTRAVIESNLVERDGEKYRVRGSLADLAIPSTLRGLLTARLDQLGRDARSVVQLASLMGREFEYRHLSAVCWLDAAELEAVLGRLAMDGLLHRRRRLSGDIYRFKQALTYEAVYESMPRTTRREYFQRIAEILMARFPELENDRPDLLARVQAGAGRTDQALSYARQAALASLHKSANEEAIGYATQAIAWSLDIEDETRRAEVELSFYAIIAPALLGTRGHGIVEFDEMARRADRSIDMVDGSRTVLAALWGLWIHRYVRAEYQVALGYMERHLTLALQLELLDAQVISRCCTFSTLQHLGRYDEARKQAEAGLALYQDAEHRELAYTMGYDPKTILFGGQAKLLWACGHLDQARAYIAHAEDRARALDHPVSQCFASSFAIYLDICCHDLESVERRARHMAEVAERAGLTQWTLLAALYTTAATRRPEDARRHLDAFHASGQTIDQTFWLGVVARAEAHTGDLDAAIKSLDRAIDLAAQTDENCYLPTLLRLAGEYRLRRDRDGTRGETCLRRAVAVARAQGASMYQLEALLPLIRYLDERSPRGENASERASQNERSEARALLEAIETTCDHPTLSEARTLLG